MQEEQIEQFNNIRSMKEQVTQLEMDYWQSYSYLDTWQFWIAIAMVVIPLIILFFTIDRQRTLLIGFFGFNYHVWFMYFDTTGIKLGLWEYPYQALPYLPSFSMDAALTFMLLYQWTINQQKNVYLSTC